MRDRNATVPPNHPPWPYYQRKLLVPGGQPDEDAIYTNLLRKARELFHQISLVLPLFFARALWQIALPPLGGVAAICHRPLGVWHPKKVAKLDQF